jgi:hypothetical protein
MLVGVFAFSFASGSLASILQNYDSQNGKVHERVAMLNKLLKEYYLPLDLYTKLKKTIMVDQSKDFEEVNKFVDQLPYKLKVDLSLFIHEDTYERIEFLKTRSHSFIAWICPLLKPYFCTYDDFVYSEGQYVSSIYFLKRGRCGYVIPNHEDFKYIDILEGDYFGTIDIVSSVIKNADANERENEDWMDNWIAMKESLFRHFTVKSLEDSHLLLLNLDDVHRMQCEFLEPYQTLIRQAHDRLLKTYKLKIFSIKTIHVYPELLDQETISIK